MELRLLCAICLIFHFLISYAQKNDEPSYYYPDNVIAEKKSFLTSAISWINTLEEQTKNINDNIKLGGPLRQLYFDLGSMENRSVSDKGKKILLKKLVDSLVVKREKMQKILAMSDEISFMETPVFLNIEGRSDIDMLRIIQDHTGSRNLYNGMFKYRNINQIKASKIQKKKVEATKSPSRENNDEMANNSLIKIVSEDYSQTLTAAKKYYDKDVDFDKIFPNKNPKEQMSFRMPVHYNILGDTVCIFKNINSSGNFFVADNGENVQVGNLIPKGNYIVSGYVFCHENWDSIRTMNNISNIGEDYYGYNGISAYERRGIGSIKKLKNEILHGSEIEIGYYLAAVKLSSLDSIGGYHYDCYCFVWSQPYPYVVGVYQYKYYNEIKKYFLNKEIIIDCDHKLMDSWNEFSREVIFDEAFLDKLIKNVENGIESNQKEIITDDLTDEEIELQDSIYSVKDVVVRNESVYLVLEGHQTGSFGYRVDEVYSMPMLYAYKNNGNMIYTLEHKKHIINLIKTFKQELIEQKKQEQIKEKQEREREYQRKKQLNEQRKQENLREAAAQQERVKKHKQDIINKYGSETGNLINNGRIAIGMTKDMCREAWGTPMNSYRTRTSNKQQEIWHYNYKTRVYFLNGKIVRIDD